MNANKSIVTIGIILAIAIGLTCGYFLGFARGGAAATATIASRLDLRSVIGRVQGISGETLTLGAASATANLTTGVVSAVWNVTVVSSTRIIGSRPNLAKLPVGGLIGAGKGAGLALTSTTPASFIITPIALSDIKAGDVVVVSAASNILGPGNSFTASAIQDQNPLQSGTIAPAQAIPSQSVATSTR